MSDDPYLSLISWDNHHGDLSSHFNYLFERESLVDVTVAAVRGSIKAHRLILSASSEYFQDILSEQPQDSHPIIILDEVKFQNLKALIKFIYKGKLTLSKEELPTFLEAAKGLKIKSLNLKAQELEQIEEDHEERFLGEQLPQQEENPAPVNREAEYAPNIRMPSTSPVSVFVVLQFFCSMCELRTARKISLRKHLQFVHNVDQSQLDTFEATALDRRPILQIKCEICGQNFKTK